MSTTCQTCGMGVQDGTEICPQCGSRLRSVNGGNVADVPKGASTRSWMLRGFVVVVAVLGIYAFYRDAFREYHPVIAKQPEITAPGTSGRINSSPVSARMEGSLMIISLKEVKERRVVRFFDPESVQTIPIIAYLTPAGRLVTAMSISENCRSRDFYLEGENIHCAGCPSYWNASSLEAYACCQKYFPDPIPSTILGDEVRLDARDVRKWQSRS